MAASTNQSLWVCYGSTELGLVSDDQETKNMVATALANAIWSQASNSEIEYEIAVVGKDGAVKTQFPMIKKDKS